MGRPDRRGIRLAGIGGEAVDVGVATAGQQHRVGGEDLEAAAELVAAHHAAGHPIDPDQLEHVPPGEQFHPTGGHLSHQGLIGAVEQLLAGLATGIEGSAQLGAAEAAVRQRAAVFAGEGNPLGHALIDDRTADLRKAMAARLTGTEIAPPDGVAEEPFDTVSVVGVIPGGVDAALGRHGMGSTRAVVERDHPDPIALLGQAGGGRGSSQTCAHDQNHEATPVRGADQGKVLPAAGPGRLERTAGKTGVRTVQRRSPL